MDKLLLTVVVALLAGCGAVTPYPTPSTPSLTIKASIAERCGSVGGCEYLGRLDGPDGTRNFTFDHGVVDVGHDVALAAPIALSPGDYRLTYIAQAFSDSIENGVRQLGPAVTCATDFTVTPEVGSVVADGVFGMNECEVHVGGQDAGGSSAP